MRSGKDLSRNGSLVCTEVCPSINLQGRIWKGTGWRALLFQTLSHLSHTEPQSPTLRHGAENILWQMSLQKTKQFSVWNVRYFFSFLRQALLTHHCLFSCSCQCLSHGEQWALSSFLRAENQKKSQPHGKGFDINLFGNSVELHKKFVIVTRGEKNITSSNYRYAITC